MEANPDLDPLQIREVLKQTAERRGEPTQPDVIHIGIVILVGGW